MVMAQEMSNLELELVRLRDRLQAKTLVEGDVWPVLDRVNGLLESEEGGAYEASLNVIHSLLSTVWSNVRMTGELGAMHEDS